jgi:hypothetical protein
MPTPRLGTRKITPELKQTKTDILLFLNLVFWLFIILLWVFYFYFYSYFLSVLSTLPSLLSHPYSHHLHSPIFSCATIHGSPSQLLFLPIIHFLHLPSPPFLYSPNCHYTIPPSYTHKLLTNLLYKLSKTQPPVIPDTSTLHYSGNIPKHTQEPQNPVAPTSLPPLTHLNYHLPF